MDVESGRTLLCRSSAHSQPKRGITPVELVAARGASSSAEQTFDTLVCDAVTEVFTVVLGNIAGQALIEAVKRHTSLEIKDLPRRPDLLDQALKAHMGSPAIVLERKILRTLAGKATPGTTPSGSDPLDLASEIEKIRQEFLRRKQAGNLPHTLE